MQEDGLGLDLGMLCRCCDSRSYHLPDVSGLTDRQAATIEKLCRLCIETNHCDVSNS